MEKQNVKEVISYPKGAFVSLTISNDGEKTYGSWYLDTRDGWMWEGNDADFLLGLRRVRGVLDLMKEDIDEELNKKEVYEALMNSITENPKDGLYNIVGDNAYFMHYIDFDEEAEAESLKEEMEYMNIPKKAIDVLINNMWIHVSDITDELINAVDEEYEWQEQVKNVANNCLEESNSASDFLMCVNNKLELDEMDEEALWEIKRMVVGENLFNALCKSLQEDWDEIKEELNKDGFSDEQAWEFRRKVQNRFCDVNVAPIFSS